MPVVSLPNVIGASIVQLRSFSELTALCGSGSPRISGAKQTSWNPMPRTAIWVRGTGGPGAGELADIDRMLARIDLYCYGATEVIAYEFWAMAHACFAPSRKSGLSRGFTQINCRVEDVAHLAGPYSAREVQGEGPVTWPVTWASYGVRYVEVPG
jgi:hypothetical protein